MDCKWRKLAAFDMSLARAIGSFTTCTCSVMACMENAEWLCNYESNQDVHVHVLEQALMAIPSSPGPLFILKFGGGGG